MKTKPILFNTEMVQAILDGRKTQTRRVIKIKNKLTRDWAITTGVEWLKVDLQDEKYPYSIREQNGAWNEYSLQDFIKKYSQYQVGDILWVREPAKVMSPPIETFRRMSFKYLADGLYVDIFLDKDFDILKKWIQRCQGIPNGCLKEMARIFLKVTNVRVERLQDTSNEDLIKEGIQSFRELCETVPDFDETLTDKELWQIIWDSTTKDGYKWEDNPCVFMYEFEKISSNEVMV